jgi:DUF1009 family protein
LVTQSSELDLSVQRFGIIAGGGQLPILIDRSLREKGEESVLFTYPGCTHELLLSDPRSIQISLGKIGAMLRCLKEKKVTHLVMAGHFRRPSFSELAFDWTGGKWFRAYLKSLQGENSLLSFISNQLEKEGFQIISPQDILQNLCFAPGIHTHQGPSPEDLRDIERGFEVLAHTSTLDMGQAVVVQQGWILGLEGAEGTDELIRRCGLLARPGKKPVLVKTPKTQQDLRLDPPVVGQSTVEGLIQEKFAGLAIDTKTLVLDQDTVKAKADQAGLFLCVQGARNLKGKETACG